MASTVFKKALNFSAINPPIFIRAYSAAKRNNLYSRISPLGDPNLSLVPVLDQWVQEGKKVKGAELQHIVRNLRARQRFQHALQIPDVLSDMKQNGVSPDNFSYRICMHAYGARSDIGSMEHILEEMENQPHITMDWLTYSTVASVYIKAGLKEKALIYLKKCEEKVSKDAVGYNNLISMYATLGNKDEMMRLWGLQKRNSKKQINRDYITMLGSLVRIGELEESKKLFEEWESSCETYDFRVPNVLLFGYSQRGLIENAEAMLRDIVKKGKTPTPNSWSIVVAGYLDKQNMEKAFECIKEALAVQEENIRWRPKPLLISSILSWLGDNGDADDVEAFISSLKNKVPKSREMFHVLIKAYTRSGKEVDGLLESMKADNITEDEETKSLR
ncbi:hypothetical protein Patl1_04618 [Pistacia atlantica]|uniref:Uncharacterized protein n=1 Tax=Pistacia atlantica TaxID=434234 RepID=A0ACC1BUQ7_9ROSI|nr:hypothetical protein Patl1_04618 [Pistacia atlantica]